MQRVEGETGVLSMYILIVKIMYMLGKPVYSLYTYCEDYVHAGETSVLSIYILIVNIMYMLTSHK